MRRCMQVSLKPPVICAVRQKITVVTIELTSILGTKVNGKRLWTFFLLLRITVWRFVFVLGNGYFSKEWARLFRLYSLCLCASQGNKQ